jgi:hypothetical protein
VSEWVSHDVSCLFENIRPVELKHFHVRKLQKS